MVRFCNKRKTGVGLVARDSLVVCTGALAVPVTGMVDPVIVETLGLLEGMKWARDRHWLRVCFETDCVVLVTALNDASIHYQNEVENIIQECLALSTTF